MTRRIVKPQPNEDGISFMKNPPLDWEQINKQEWKPWKLETEEGESISLKCPYGQPGHILWVRETFYAYGSWAIDKFGAKFSDKTLSFGDYKYADNPPVKVELKRGSLLGWYKRPSLFMPKAACRTWLEITNIKVERLQDISEDDAIAEGVIEYQDGTFKNYFKKKGLREQDGVECLLAKGSFQSLWHSINGQENWDKNPWVWVISFKEVTNSF
ncbi:hypothetical protein [Limnovirga soli]|uniref:Uncharacterized protein n=1 Tax=Limnovirga soli TaxID=2656915 RepID=A0A8J8JRI1_9BACT|nr:hypothetical protein [Limnovirga soli]NNV55892.1 hypothetical protein [Limnovirga soli]